MGGSVVVGGLLASVVPGEAKPLPALRKSVSAVALSSEAAKPCNLAREARNAMTLLPGEGLTEQGWPRESNQPKSSISPVLVVGATADPSPLTGEEESPITKEEAVISTVGDGANYSRSALQCQEGHSNETPTLSATRDVVDTHHGGARCAESETDKEEEGVTLPTLRNSNCMTGHGSSQHFEAIGTTDEHEGRSAVEPKLVATSTVKLYAATREGQAVGAGEVTGTCAGEDDLEFSDSRGEDISRTRPPHDVVEDVLGSSKIPALAMGACVDNDLEPSTAGKTATPATPTAVADIDVGGDGMRLETTNEAEGGSGSITGGSASETGIVVQAEHGDAADRERNGTEEASVAMPPSPEQSLPPTVEGPDGVNGGATSGPSKGGVFLPSESFDGAKDGYVFRLGDRGLGFYVDGYVDRRTKASHAPAHRPWNAGPGDNIVRRGPIGPVHKPFKKISRTRRREEKGAAEEEPNMRPLTTRLAAQRNARVFQSALVERSNVAGAAHTLAMLENLSDPTFSKGQAKLEFVKAECRCPGAYDTDGRAIPEEGVLVSNELHRTDEQKQRTRAYGFKAMQRFRVAHDDLVGVISKKDEDLQNALKNVDPATLQDIEEQAVSSSVGAGVYRQKGRVGRESDHQGRSSTMARPIESPEKLRDKFAQSLEVQIRGKEKALMKKVAGLDEEETKQVVEDIGKGAECLPDSWRHNPDSFRKIQIHRKQLVAEIAADRQKVVCPWRPGGRRIAHEPWQAFFPRDHRPPVRSASEENNAGNLDQANRAATAQECEKQRPSTRGSAGGGEGAGGRGRPHTAPSHRRKPFRDIIGPSARRVLAAQSTGMPLHDAFYTYSNEHPLPRCEPALRPTWQSGQALRSPGSCTDTPPQFFPGGSTGHGRQQRGWSPMIDTSSNRSRTLSNSNAKRPHSAAPKTQRHFRTPPQRPSTASGATNAPESVDGLGGRPSEGIAPEREQERRTGSSSSTNSQPLDLEVRSRPGVTVLWARLCKPSSDLAYEGSTCPSRPRTSGPSHTPRQRDKPSRKVATETVVAARVNPAKRDHVGGARASAVSSTPVVDAKCKDRGDVRRLSGRGKGGGEGSLVDLEDRLLASTWKRIHQRHIVFRGYAERSRRARVWDPGSVCYTEGASENHSASPRSRSSELSERGERGGTFMMAFPGARNSTRNCRREKRNRRKYVAANGGHPVEMDWIEVDTRRFRETADKIEASLEGKLCAAVTDNSTGELLEDCFREAQYFVASAGALLGCSKDEQERFNKQPGENLEIDHYAATVTRLSILWAAMCGVVEIVGMLQRRKKLLEVFYSERHRSATQSKGIAGATTLHDDDDKTTGQESLLATPASTASVTAVSPVPLVGTRHDSQYWKRLELAEISTAIAESLKLWLGIVPWRVEVLYEGKKLVPTLAAEEKTLPWPPDPESCTTIHRH